MEEGAVKGDLAMGSSVCEGFEMPRLQRVITSSMIHKVSEQGKGGCGNG